LQVAVLSLPGLKPRLQEMRWLLLSLKSFADAAGARIETDNPIKQQAFKKVVHPVIPMAAFRERRVVTETGR